MTAKLLKQAGVVGTVMLLASLGFQSLRITASVAAGVGLALANLWLLIRFARHLTDGAQQLSGLVARCLVKFLSVGIILWWVVTQTTVQPAALLVGLSCVVIPIAGMGLGIGAGHARV